MEEPKFNKCCYCIPLTLCLYTLIIVKILGDVTLSGLLTYLMIVIFSSPDRNFGYFMPYVFGSLEFLVILDCIFMVVLGVGLFKKNVKVLRISLCINITMAIVTSCFWMFMFFIFTTYIGLFDNEDILVPFSGTLHIQLGLIINIITKSEMVKLRRKQQQESLKTISNITETQNTKKAIDKEEMV